MTKRENFQGSPIFQATYNIQTEKQLEENNDEGMLQVRQDEQTVAVVGS